VTVALALALSVAAPLLPPSAEARYRVELAGEHVGWALLREACGAATCDVEWRSELRLPVEAGGGTAGREIAARVRPDGRALLVVARARADGRVRPRQHAGEGPVPASLAELVLSRTLDGERRCVRVRDEESGREGEACARRDGAWLEGQVLDEPIRFRARAGELPVEVLLPAQRARFVADGAAALPVRAPRLFGVEVPLAAGARRFCGVALDPPPPPAPAEVPRSYPNGTSCRERSSRYVGVVERAGLRARHAVGVAFDGRAYVWHEWVEVLAAGRWVPVDPSFEQAPAEGPRFTVARFGEGDRVSRAEAGRAVLTCWSAR